MNVQLNNVGPEWSCRGKPLAPLSRSRLRSSLRSPIRIVTVACLSNCIADTFISEALARALQKQTGSSVLLVRLERADGRTTLQEWARICPQVNGEFGL